MMDTLFNTNFDSTPSTHDLPGVKLKAHTYGKKLEYIACLQLKFLFFSSFKIILGLYINLDMSYKFQITFAFITTSFSAVQTYVGDHVST